MSNNTHCTLNVKRNSRERKRVQNINVIIRELKDKLPVEWTSKKMGKLEILQKSTLYIKHLLDVLNDSASGTEKTDDVPRKSPLRTSEEIEPLLLLEREGSSNTEICQLPNLGVSMSEREKMSLNWNFEQNSVCMQQELTNFLPNMDNRRICDNVINEGNSSDACLSPCYSTPYKDQSEMNNAFWL